MVTDRMVYRQLDEPPELNHFAVIDSEVRRDDVGAVVSEAAVAAEDYLGKGMDLYAITVSAAETDSDYGLLVRCDAAREEGGQARLAFFFQAETEVLVWFETPPA